MPRRPSSLLPGLPALALAVCLTAALSACGADEEPATAPATDRAAGPGPSGTPAASAEPAEPSTSPSRSSRPRPNRTLAPLPSQRLLARPVGSHLLPADRMPTVAADLPWTEVKQGEGGEPVGACQKASLFDIGAMRTAARHFAAEDGSTTATQVVGRFPDGTSAWRAAQVLSSWRADCADRLEHPRTSVGEARDVPVRTGSGSAYVATYGPRAAGRGRATGLGIVRKGSWVTVVEIATGEARWPQDADPARQAVRRIARTFRG